MNKEKKLLVFSVDAMVCEDLALLREKPNFRKYLAGGCEVTGGMKGIYPSVTYPAHVSMVTGCYPASHKVTSNFSFTTTGKDQNWLWFSDAYRTEDLFAAAKKAGYTTGAISWPCSARNPNIDWLMAEYWMPNPGDTLTGSFRDAGSSEEMLEIIESCREFLPEGYEKGGKKNFMQWPQIDRFNIRVACEVIEKHAPDVMFVHVGLFDAARHAHGCFGEHIAAAVKELDGYIGQLGEACERAGYGGALDFVLVSDHGQMDIRRSINLNVLLADGGFLQTDERGRVTSWKAYSFSNAMSSLVYVADPADDKLCREVYHYLCHLCKEGIYGIGRVFTRREAAFLEHLDGEFCFVLESDGYTSFGDGAVRPLVHNFDCSDYRFGKATHGYLPEKGPQPVFVAKGPDFIPNRTQKRGRLIDEAPTFAAILGVGLPEADGRAMTGLLRKEEKEI